MDVVWLSWCWWLLSVVLAVQLAAVRAAVQVRVHNNPHSFAEEAILVDKHACGAVVVVVLEAD